MCLGQTTVRLCMYYVRSRDQTHSVVCVLAEAQPLRYFSAAIFIAIREINLSAFALIILNPANNFFGTVGTTSKSQDSLTLKRCVL